MSNPIVTCSKFPCCAPIFIIVLVYSIYPLAHARNIRVDAIYRALPDTSLEDKSLPSTLPVSRATFSHISLNEVGMRGVIDLIMIRLPGTDLHTLLPR